MYLDSKHTCNRRPVECNLSVFILEFRGSKYCVWRRWVPCSRCREFEKDAVAETPQDRNRPPQTETVIERRPKKPK